jgi:hypothetical protein
MGPKWANTDPNGAQMVPKKDPKWAQALDQYGPNIGSYGAQGVGGTNIDRQCVFDQP